MVSVRTEQADIQVTLTAVGNSTKVNIAASFSGTYNNPETTYDLDRSCAPTA